MVLPQVEDNIRRLLDHSALSEKEINLVTSFFNDYKDEFVGHISEEEQNVLPYILELETQSTREKPDPAFIEKLHRYSIREFEKEHDRLETSLENLSRLIIKYLPPFEDFQLCNHVLNDLAALVKDLIDHANMEDKVLILRVTDLEQQLLQKHGADFLINPNLIEKTIVLRISPPAGEVDEVHFSISLWEGEKVITETIKKMLSLHSLDSESDPFQKLTRREETIVRLVSMGLTNKQIAQELFLSTHTVTTHRKNISSKLGIKSVSGLTVYAIVNNIITIDEVTSKPDQ